MKTANTVWLIAAVHYIAEVGERMIDAGATAGTARYRAESERLRGLLPADR